MPKITDIRFIVLSAPLPEGKRYGMSKMLTGARQTTLVVLDTDDGIQGVGEARNAPGANVGMLPLLKNYLTGVELADVELVFSQVMARHYHFGLQGALLSAISGIDIAAKDALGKALQLPVCRLIGGRRLAKVPVYASGGYLTADAERDLPPQIEAMAQAGYQAVKIKIGQHPVKDGERVRLSRRILGEQVALMVDMNGNYTLDLAKASIRAMQDAQIAWAEEPLAAADFAGYAELRRWSDVPIATGEALYSAHDFLRLLSAGGADVVQPDLCLGGGFWQGRRTADLAELHHVRLSPHVWGSAVGLAAAVHFVASRSAYPQAQDDPWPSLIEYDVSENPLRDQLLTTPMTAIDGFIPVPDQPGLGIEIDWATVQRYSVT
jgi:D-galactarolactone cycloisomerase